MLVVETIAKIRRAHFVDGKSIKQICRELRVSRNTVRKVMQRDKQDENPASIRKRTRGWGLAGRA
jgi:orotate phosphoribosyltransferase-like protein